MKSFIRAAFAASLAIAAALAVRAPPALAHAVGQAYTFAACTHNDPVSVATAEDQIVVYVVDNGDGTVTFHFHNNGPLASSITDIYFDDGSLLAIASVTDGPGTDFEPLATPVNLPVGNDCVPDFETTAGFSADSEPPVQPNGANPSEYVDITFTLQGSQTFDDVVAELKSGALRIGIHVQGITCPSLGVARCSEGLVNTTPTAVNMSSLGATAARGQVTLAWRTGSEISNAGFNVYRATSASGARVKVNDLLIAAQGSEASGSSYSLVDRPGYGSFYYWLEGVDYTGQSSLHGPIPVNVRAAVQRPLYRPTLPGLSR
jgi:hypothetical protein